LRAVYPVYERIPQHRGQSNAFLGGDTSQRANLDPLAEQIGVDFAALANLDDQLGNALGTSARLADIRSRWVNLRGGVYEMAQDDSWRLHTELIADVLRLIEQVADNSGLRSDPDIGDAYLVRALVEALPRAQESLGQLRGLGSGYAARQLPLDRNEQSELIYLTRSAEDNLRVLETSIDLIGTDKPQLRASLEEALGTIPQTTRGYLLLASDAIIDAEVPTIDAGRFFDRGTETIAPYFGIQNLMVQDLDTELQNRLAEVRNEILIAAALVAVAALLTFGLIVLIARSITGQVARLNILFAEIGQGRFEARSAVTSSDELGQMTASLNTMLDNTLVLIQDRDERDRIQRSIRRLLEQVSDVADGDLRQDLAVTDDITGSIADSFNYMLEELRTIIGGVQSTTARVTDTAGRLATSSQQLADGSIRQTVEIENTAESVRQLATSAREVSANAETSSEVANRALDSARVGGEAVERTIDGMGKIRQRVQDTSKRIKRLGESSQQIGEIVELISDLADRTSLLALNASIQAAAAGEAGRSFAVVAKEVEQLAERSTESTKRIAQLIGNIQRDTAEASAAMDDTTREVVEGSALATDAGRALQNIGEVSGQLATLANDIVQRARRQAEVSETVAGAIGQIDGIARQTSGGVAETVSELDELSAMVDQLRNSVSTFQLPDSPEAVRTAA
ncbi:MAG: methyl-accepting chemotaxis protein, partial [Acidobacteriota bacterium]